MTTSTLLDAPLTSGDVGIGTWVCPFEPECPLSTRLPVYEQRDWPLAIDAATPAPHQWSLRRQLDALQNTPEAERWPAADWPSEQAFADARSFIQSLPPGPIHLPNMGLADDGEINFLWANDGVHIDLGLYGMGTFSYFARARSGQKFYGDDVPAWRGLPGEIANLIRV